MKRVTREEFENFILNYPRKLEIDVCGICEPPEITYNDFTISKYWPGSIVARRSAYVEDPNSCYYRPEEERIYMINESTEEKE